MTKETVLWIVTVASTIFALFTWVLYYFEHETWSFISLSLTLGGAAFVLMGLAQGVLY